MGRWGWGGICGAVDAGEAQDAACIDGKRGHIEIRGGCRNELGIERRQVGRAIDRRELDIFDFSKYAVDDFTVDHHKELSDLARQTADSLGCTVIISNHDTEEIRKFYNEANEIVSFMVKRTISSKTSERKKAPELLAIYKGEK